MGKAKQKSNIAILDYLIFHYLILPYLIYLFSHEIIHRISNTRHPLLYHFCCLDGVEGTVLLNNTTDAAGIFSSQILHCFYKCCRQIHEYFSDKDAHKVNVSTKTNIFISSFSYINLSKKFHRFYFICYFSRGGKEEGLYGKISSQTDSNNLVVLKCYNLTLVMTLLCLVEYFIY